MSDFMEEYKGYIGSVHYSAEDEVFHGKLEGIRDLITYEGTDAASLKRAFHEAVNDYLETCQKKNKAPDTPFKGTFNVRVGVTLHKRAAYYAAEHGRKLNSVVIEALEKYLQTAH
ncbi:MAG: type II toxin-antitoxin system HicB family antitoxin [Acidobacteriaceae bacterium]|nr:type II toxin-antitoxin system HicB family antitoxin [Acidobacteriaceae bacterium]MBV9678856.1 type II toxin-antitoxin system HicB family antitoxin [Acidobacteriaceae bacterium]